MDINTLHKQLEKAFALRKPLFSSTNALRLVNGLGDNLPGVTLDLFNTHLLIQYYQDFPVGLAEEILAWCEQKFPVTYAQLRWRPTLEKNKTPPETRVLKKDSSAQTVVIEFGHSFHIDFNEPIQVGLFTDLRHVRNKLMKNIQGKRVLNTFAYTGSFSVYAMAGGASRVVTVDINKKYLEWAKTNFALNKLDVNKAEWVPLPTHSFLDFACKKHQEFDLIILDPPSFSRYKGQTFSVEKNLSEWVSQCIRILAEGGSLWVSTNLSEWNNGVLLKCILNVCDDLGVEFELSTQWSQDIDYTGSGFSKEASLSAYLMENKKSPTN